MVFRAVYILYSSAPALAGDPGLARSPEGVRALHREHVPERRLLHLPRLLAAHGQLADQLAYSRRGNELD